MNRFVLSGAKLAAVVLALGLAGCDSGGIEEGVPKDLSPSPGVDPNMMKIQMKPNVVPGATPAGGAPATPPKP